jgi:hypothetical protein
MTRVERVATVDTGRPDRRLLLQVHETAHAEFNAVVLLP